MDAQDLTVPLWGAIAVGGTCLTVVIGVVLWAFQAFATKAEHEDHNTRILALEKHWSEIGRDISYIRGRLEPKA